MSCPCRPVAVLSLQSCLGRPVLVDKVSTIPAWSDDQTPRTSEAMFLKAYPHFIHSKSSKSTDNVDNALHWQCSAICTVYVHAQYQWACLCSCLCPKCQPVSVLMPLSVFVSVPMCVSMQMFMFKFIFMQHEHEHNHQHSYAQKHVLYMNMHCKPSEAYTRLKTASCEAGPGTTHMWILEICLWSLQILEIAARYVFHNSVFGLSKCHLYIEFISN
jgi:hypothetical protein